MGKRHCTAILLAGGQGRRMGTNVPKQYLDIAGKPLIYYSLHVFEQSEIIDDVILVTERGQTEYVQKEIVEKYGFKKVLCTAEGGTERYLSVWSGLCALRERGLEGQDGGLVFIHDSARPFADGAMLKRLYDEASKHRACAAGMPSKDTVKLVDERDFALNTPDRSRVWIVQTPQVFETSLILAAYSGMMREQCIHVTDDAMVVETWTDVPVKMVRGSYRNIKVTTIEDLEIAGALLGRQ